MAVAVALAILRRDGPSVIAMSFSGIVAANLAGFPSDMLAICCAILIVVIVVSPFMTLLMAMTGGGRAFASVAAVSSLILFASHEPSVEEVGLPSWTSLSKAGKGIQHQVRTLTSMR